MVQWEVRIVTAGWLVSIYTTYEVWVKRIVDGSLTNEHQFVGSVFTGLPPKTFVAVERLSLNFDGDSLSKSWRVHYLDFAGNPAYFDVSVSVPPFNNQTSTTTGWQDEEIIIYLPPPPTPLPPPTPPPPIPEVPPEGPPIDVILEPPGESPRPITLPPPVPPEPPIDWRPGPLPPDIVPPPRTRDTDIFTLRQFAAKWGHQIDRYALNVPLDGGEVVEELEEPYRSFWQRLTTHKADIVFERRGVVYVAEIKPRLSRGAIGEAITAHELFKRLYRFPQETRAAVICQTAHPTLIQTASWLDCLVYVTEQIDTGQPAGLYRGVGR
jgi:hypothetical protein